ncbi:cytochrome P450 [Schizopora paradoxa]|uniref:Cytochrome P450 n=1 Tax=Schizopora paradoxa TaxID=27342 RepID=A0A0H2SL53_9AGAM|nr:cytochrome P450 [Schizopora paradoxa]
MNWASVSALLSAFVLSILYTGSRKKDKRRYPPGPAADPIVGNVRSFPQHDPHKVFSKWGKTFGELTYVHVLGKPIIVLNSLDIIKNLLDKRGMNYSGRPRAILYEMIKWSETVILLPFGEKWKKQRRMISENFTPTTVKEYFPLLENEVLSFVRRFEGRPDCLDESLHRLLSGTMLRLTYGHIVQSDDDSFMERIGRAAHLLALYPNPGAMPVDFFPFLRYLPVWFPGMGFIRHANSTRDFVAELTEDLYKIVEDDVLSGRMNTSLVAKWRGDSKKAKSLGRDDIIDVKMNGFTTYVAGVETTESTIFTFYLMMIVNPEIQRRAQLEIDQFVATEGRLPSFEDRTQLPFVGCILKEVYRFGPPLPLAVPHTTFKDDVYKNMFIPGGSLVIPNIWGLMNDEKVFPDPNVFNPDRHMTKTGAETKNEVSSVELGSEKTIASDPSTLVFGFGRRICPGKQFADGMVWLVIARTLAVFDVLPPLNETTGKPELPEVEYITTATARPKDFKCRVLPRSERHLSLLRD